MKLCPACQRHLRAPEERCPFCGAEQRSGADLSGTGLVASVVLSAMLAACGDRPLTTSEGTGTTGTTGTTATPTTDGSVSSSDATLDTDDEGCAFYAGCPPDVGKHRDCDVFAQDCPPGQKCAATDNWSIAECVPVGGDQQPGDACTTPEGPSAGIDDCEAGAMCFGADVDTLQGTCVALCTGTADDPVCAADLTCLIANQGVLNLCVPVCDPLLADCPGDDLCVPNGQQFVCVYDASGDTGQLNDPCDFVNSCDKGLACVNTNMASSACMNIANGCCQPFCDFVKMEPCPNPDQKCVQWFDPMMPIPPGSEDVGVCGIPG